MDIKQEIQSLSPTGLVELFVLDATMFAGGDVYRFHSGLSQTNQPVVWQGETYLPIPLEATGFDLTAQGTMPQPSLKIANVGGALSAMALSMEDLIGARVTRKRTFVRYLDAVNFPKGNSEANPDQYFPDELWFIDSKVIENRHQVEWRLASAFDLDGVKLPFRQIIKSTCPWKYRSTECGYTGSKCFKRNDEPTNDMNEDVCGKRLGSCKLRFDGPLPFGGFPGAERGAS